MSSVLENITIKICILFDEILQIRPLNISNRKDSLVCCHISKLKFHAIFMWWDGILSGNKFWAQFGAIKIRSSHIARTNCQLWDIRSDPGGFYNTSETYLKLKSSEISFIHNLLLSHAIILKFCPEDGSITAVLCASFQNDLTTEMDVMEEWDFERYKLN